MRLHIEHETHYAYASPAHYALLQLRIRPKSNATQTVLDWELTLEGAHHHASFADQYGAHVDLVELHSDAKSVRIKVAGNVETQPGSGVLGHQQSLMPRWFYLRQTDLTQTAPQVAELVTAAQKDGSDTLSSLHALSRMIIEMVEYKTGATDVNTTAAEALTLGAGVCQDHAHIFLSAARQMGIPARYVSGYLMMNDRLQQEASHAWAETYIEDLGWVGFDVSNGISPDERYVKIAHGLDYSDCAPTRGVIIGGAREDVVVSIQVQQ